MYLLLLLVVAGKGLLWILPAPACRTSGQSAGQTWKLPGSWLVKLPGSCRVRVQLKPRSLWSSGGRSSLDSVYKAYFDIIHTYYMLSVMVIYTYMALHVCSCICIMYGMYVHPAWPLVNGEQRWGPSAHGSHMVHLAHPMCLGY